MTGKNLHGYRVRVTGITDQEDADLNGRTGIVCAKHFVKVGEDPRTVFGDVGIVLDGDEKMRFANLNYGEFEEITDEKSEAIYSSPTDSDEHGIRADRLQ
jgi:hypothetical protein